MIGLIDHVEGNIFSIDSSLIMDSYARIGGEWHIGEPLFAEEIQDFLDGVRGDIMMVIGREPFHAAHITFGDDTDAIQFKLLFC